MSQCLKHIIQWKGVILETFEIMIKVEIPDIRKNMSHSYALSNLPLHLQILDTFISL